jgi:hypothetical protein
MPKYEPAPTENNNKSPLQLEMERIEAEKIQNDFLEPLR